MLARTFAYFLTQLRYWRKEPLIPAALLLIACGLLAFIELGEFVREEAPHSFDQRILLAMREANDPADPIGPAWMEEMGRDVTALGGFTILTGLTISAIGFMLLHRRFRLSLLTLAAVLGGMQASASLKHLFGRPRPDLVPHEVLVTSASFPSGHAMMAAVVYLTLGVLMARTQRRRRVRLYIVTLSLIVAVAVGVSRVYLGVHWPTDVLAGWALGGAWALAFGLLALKADPRRPGDEDGGDETAAKPRPE